MLADDTVFDWKSYDANMSTNIFYVEKELGVYITEDYPLAKLISQLKELNNYNEKKQREMDKSDNKRGTIR